MGERQGTAQEGLYSDRWFVVFLYGKPGDPAVSCLTPASTQVLIGLAEDQEVFLADHLGVILDAWSGMIESGRWIWDRLVWVDTVNGLEAHRRHFATIGEDLDVWLYPHVTRVPRDDARPAPIVPTA